MLLPVLLLLVLLLLLLLCCCAAAAANNNYNKMADYFLGIVQIVIGWWFLGLGGLMYLMGGLVHSCDNNCHNDIWRIGVITISIFAIFISSGCLAFAAAGEKPKALLIASLGFSILSSSLSLLTLSIVGYKEYREEQGLVYAVGLPALIMFIVTTISAISSGIRVSLK